MMLRSKASCCAISQIVIGSMATGAFIRSFPPPANNEREEEMANEGVGGGSGAVEPTASPPPSVGGRGGNADSMHDDASVPPATRGKGDYVQIMRRAYDFSAETGSVARAPLPFGEAGAASDVAPMLQGRAVEIIASGRSHTRAAPKWQIRFNPLQKWLQPLTGWTATGDPMESCPEAALWFHTREQALRFCARQGWRATAAPEARPARGRQARFAGYGDNFTVKRAGVPDLSHLPSRRGGGGGGGGSGMPGGGGEAGGGAPRG